MDTQRTTVVRRVAQLAGADQQPADILASALTDVCEHLGFSSGAIYRVDGKCTQISVVTFHGVSERMRTRLAVFPLNRSPELAELCRGESAYLSHEKGMPELGDRFVRELGMPNARWILVPMRAGNGGVGVLALLGGDSRAFSEEEIEVLDLVSYQLASILVMMDRLEAASSERERLQHDLRTSHAMLRAAEVMAEKADLDSVLTALARVVYEELGRQTIVTLVNQERSELSVAAGAGSNIQLGRHVPLTALDPVLRQSLLERRSVVIESGPTPSALGMISGRFLSVPLIHDSNLIGNIEVDAPPTERTALAREVRLLQGVAFEASAAIANARLYEQQRRSATLREALNDVNAMLNESIERPKLLKPVLDRAVEVFPADSAVLALLEQDEWIAAYTSGPTGVEAGAVLQAEDVSNAQHALRAGAPVLRPEGLVGRLQGEGETATPRLVLVVPLLLQNRAFGAIFFRRTNWVWSLDSETLDFASKLGASVSLTLGNRYLYEHEHQVSETLQQALLSVPEDVPGLRIAHLYLAAVERTRVGGDFYDVFELADDRVALVIGDVSGKGLDAAALTALAKNTLKAHAVEGLPPSQVLERANDTIYKFSSTETFVTVFLGLLHPVSGDIEYANAGHLPPLLFKQGEARSLEAEGPLLGAFSGATYEDYRNVLQRGESLLLYTDGLTEARGEGGELFGEERLMQVLAKLGDTDIEDVPRLAVESVEEFSASGLSDDVAILAVRLDTPAPR